MNIDLLKRLCETPGVPGREHRVRELIKAEVEAYCDEIHVDAMGSLHCIKKPANGAEAAKKIGLFCHMDEIGFLVTHVSKEGWITVDPVGGFDRRNLFSRRVLVCTESGDFKGVMNPAGKPIHILPPEDAKKIPEVSDFFIDIGLGEKTVETVQIGDYVVMDEPFFEMGEKVVSKALDNRIACWLGIEVLKGLKDSGTPHEVHMVFTTQEEIGLRGAGTAAFAVAGDIVFGIDTTLACDTPGVPEKQAVTVQGKGAGIHIKDGSLVSDVALVKQIEALAKDKNIPAQRTILPRGGQDGGAAQRAGAGAKAIGIVVGTRYIHTVTETIDKTDLNAARDLIIASLQLPELGA